MAWCRWLLIWPALFAYVLLRLALAIIVWIAERLGMVIPEEHIVSSRYDASTGTCHYVVKQGDRLYTVSIPRQHLDSLGGDADTNAKRRRAHLMKAIAARLKLPPDDEPATTNPAKE